MGFQEPEQNKEVLNNSKMGTEMKPGRSKFEKQGQKQKPKTKLVSSG